MHANNLQTGVSAEYQVKRYSLDLLVGANVHDAVRAAEVAGWTTRMATVDGRPVEPAVEPPVESVVEPTVGGERVASASLSTKPAWSQISLVVVDGIVVDVSIG